MAKLVITDSYFNIFPTLIGLLKGEDVSIEAKKFVFCEEKITLMAERCICNELGGSFNTEVFSFGNFLRVRKNIDRTLSKEGSAMVVRRILSGLSLKKFNSGKKLLAPSLFELITQLKSAKVTPEDLKSAAGELNGLLKNKIEDVYAVYAAYEEYVNANGYDDQNSLLSYLPEVIEQAEDLKNSDVYLVGFDSFTAQSRAAVTSLLKTARSVTAILTCGENPYVYLNETALSFERLCKDAGVVLIKEKSPYNLKGTQKTLADNLFNPSGLKETQKEDANVYLDVAANVFEETLNVAKTIKRAVIDEGLRYRDMTVIIPPDAAYKSEIQRSFNKLCIPYFIDEKKKPENHPLITLILSYADLFRYGMERKEVCDFCKNPLIADDKDVADKFENHVLKYNVNYNRFKDAFEKSDDIAEDYERIEGFRRTVCELTERFNVRELLDKINAEEKINALSEELKAMGEYEQAAINEQIYDATVRVLDEMEMIFGRELTDAGEFGKMFSDGVSAMELSIIPQYNDSVFVGGFKEAGLACAKKLFALGLTADVPAFKDDVAMLSDSDINALADIKLMVEPKIRVVNHRLRENAALGLCAFSDSLYLSYPVSNLGGDKNAKSEIIIYADNMFNLKTPAPTGDYVTKRLGYDAFARACGDFAEGLNADMGAATAFYKLDDGDRSKDILESARKELKEKLSYNAEVLVSDKISPTAIEAYYHCPYQAFAKNALGLKDREEGGLDGLSVGDIMHGILKLYIDDIDKVSDKVTSDALFEEIRKKTESDKNVAFLLKDAYSAANLSFVMEECKKHCYNFYLGLQNSPFKPEKGYREIKFTDDAEGRRHYPAIPLLDGKVKLTGKIDRVDIFGDYCTVIDYKTGGKKEADEKSLYMGKELQLYLYAAAVNDKKTAGMYYYSLKDNYVETGKEGASFSGKSINAEFRKDGTIEYPAQDKEVTVYGEKFKNTLSAESIEKYVEYAVKVSEKAVRNMEDGVIVPSPVQKGRGCACDYCEYKGLCGVPYEMVREEVKANEDVIVKAAEEEV